MTAGLRLADAFRTEDEPEIADGDFLLTCTCGLEQRLDEMTIEDLGGLTLYDCGRCESTDVAIMHDDAATRLWLSSSAMTRRQEAAGHRHNGYVVGSRVDVALRPPDADDDLLLIVATPNLFAALRNL
ncbi:MAG: hypothetical protein QOJ46_203 [bacterium]